MEVSKNQSTNSKSPAQLLYNRWLEAVGTREPETVLDLYAEDAALWGTLATETKIGRERIRTYFDWFLDRASLVATPLTSDFRHLSPDIVVANGSYKFQLGGKSDTDPVAETDARFTFVFRKSANSDEWFIVEHHSSKFPDAASSLEAASKTV